MRFEVSERIITKASKETVLAELEQQFKKISEVVSHHGDTLIVESIEASFGSINRSDTSTIELKKKDDGFLIVASVHYRPSFWFWIILIITLFTWVFWLIPIAFYLIQKKTVQTGIQEVFTRIKHEFMNSVEIKPQRQDHSNIEHLEKFAALKEKGIITDEEFQIKKKELLGI